MQNKPAKWVALIALAAALGVIHIASASPGKLDNATCLNCHDGRKGKLESKTGAEPRDLHAVAPDKYARSVHAGMECVACHTDIRDNAETANAHQPDPGQAAAKVDCATCHQALWDTVRKENTTREKPRLGVIAENIEAYKTSLHARPNADDKTRPNASCEDCHSSHSFNLPTRGSARHGESHLSIPDTCGTKCHDEQMEAYVGSIHGKEVLEKHNFKSAVCTDCHNAHAVGNTSSNRVKLAITAECGSCHEESYATYKATYHGQINALGYAYTAKCFNCHGSHGVLAVKDPQSKVHPDNRMKTCRECHNGKKDLPDAPPGFATFQPHGHASDFKRYPEIWIANKIMTQLLVGTFAFFWLHTLLWFYREYRERQQRKSQPHVLVDALSEVPARLRGKHVQRFSRAWRIAHITFALSLMLLTLTGIPLFYPEAPWAAPLMSLLGGPRIAGTIHRINAVVFAGVFVWHLIYVTVKLARDWKNFQIFGANSLVPGLQDLKDIVAMFKWFVGKGPRPLFDRWTYWEKFDYWAPFWGVTIIGFSGLLMWVPHLTAQYLPGWAFNVAAIFHGEEAFLAVVFLFTVHFFNNHFRPDKFPLELVMFTGTITIEDLKQDHPLQYQRLLESGELEKHLVDAPSAPMLKASRVLGFTLIVMGLILLTLLGTGFVSSF
ncbi:MAG: cytochrome C [Candidatus Accumulibacter sp.]|uniref:Cytochrome C n=1 Tax=Candidatus Accumulibacter affinis TaxID=2954384 RepID=A0A935W6A1_9PROT|nr:cytochrome C [Candidatus Accumulibacter affinis]